VKMVQQHG